MGRCVVMYPFAVALSRIGCVGEETDGGTASRRSRRIADTRRIDVGEVIRLADDEAVEANEWWRNAGV